MKARVDGADESVFDFAARRVGRQFAERVIAPMVLGVFAGDAKKISLPAAFPLLDTLEREHGSLFKGMAARARARKRAARQATASGAGQGASGGGGPAGPAGTLTSFEGGLQALPRAIAARGSFAVRCGVEVAAVERDATGGWMLRLRDGERLAADAVALCGEPWAMAPLVEGAAPDIASELQALYCPPVIVIALGFGAASLAKVPRGFGALIPRSEGFRMLGCLWDTHLFPARSPEGHLLIRVMLGGAVDPAVANESDDALVAIVRQELGRLSGLTEEPLYRRVARWPRAIPQYELGHLDRVARVEAALANHPGLFLAGNALHGISFTKSASYGLEVGEQAATWIAGQRPSAT
jgi:oxygen-dependent protoporphyrinogen oxidase